MQALETIATLKPLLHIEDIADQFMVLLARNNSQLRRRFLDGAERFHDQHGMMRDDRAAAFTNDRRMRDAFGIANVHNVPHDVVGIFLQRIICRAIEIAARTIVIDAKPAADIQISKLVAKLRNFRVIARRFAHGALDN